MTSNATKPNNTKSIGGGRLYVNRLVLASLFVALSLVLKMAFEIYFMPQLRFNFTSVPIMLSGIFLGPIWGLAVGAISDILNFIIKPAGPYFFGFTLTSALTGFIPGLIFWLTRKNKEFKFYILNIINFVVLVGGMIYLLNANNVVSIKDKVIYLKDAAMPWYIFAILLAVFALYLGAIIWFLRKKETKDTDIPVDKILFAVTSVEIVCSLVLNSIFLSQLYSMAVFAMLPMRFLKSIVVIPIFTFVCFILCNVIARYKLQKK